MKILLCLINYRPVTGYDPRVFFKKIFLVLYAAYFVVREEGVGWGGKTLMEE